MNEYKHWCGNCQIRIYVQRHEGKILTWQDCPYTCEYATVMRRSTEAKGERAMDDSISRQAAIDALEEPCKVSDTWTDEYAIGERTQWEKDVKTLTSLPSAQPEQRWIPVTERLPSGQRGVIVSCCDDSGDSKYSYTSCGWMTRDGEYWIVDGEINYYVIAWMPLPEPYAERRTDED